MNRAERSRQLQTLAMENDWRFSPTGNVAAMEKFEFPTGEKRVVESLENLIEGEDFKVFDVYWKSELKVSDAFGPLAHKNMSAKNARQQTFILFELKDVNLPKVHVYPASSVGWLDKIFQRSSSAEFAKRWTVQGDGKDFFNEKMIEFYEKSGEFWTFADKNLLFIYQPDVLIEPLQIADWTERISPLAKLFANR